MCDCENLCARTVVRDPSGTLVAMSCDLNGLYAKSSRTSSLVTIKRSNFCFSFTTWGEKRQVEAKKKKKRRTKKNNNAEGVPRFAVGSRLAPFRAVPSPQKTVRLIGIILKIQQMRERLLELGGGWSSIYEDGATQIVNFQNASPPG